VYRACVLCLDFQLLEIKTDAAKESSAKGLIKSPDEQSLSFICDVAFKQYRNMDTPA